MNVKKMTAYLRRARRQMQALQAKEDKIYGRVTFKLGTLDESSFVFDYLHNGPLLHNQPESIVKRIKEEKK